MPKIIGSLQCPGQDMDPNPGHLTEIPAQVRQEYRAMLTWQVTMFSEWPIQEKQNICKSYFPH